MLRREFLASGALAGCIVAGPVVAGVSLAEPAWDKPFAVSPPWLVSDHRAADAVALALAAQGAKVRRVGDDVAALWYGHGPGIMAGGIMAAGAGRGAVLRGLVWADHLPLLAQLAHLRARIVPLSLAMAPAGFAAWEMRPWHDRAQTGRRA